jgi:hypothetical protein
MRRKGKHARFKAEPLPSFQRRGGSAFNKEIPFLGGADGVVSEFQRK